MSVELSPLRASFTIEQLIAHHIPETTISNNDCCAWSVEFQEDPEIESWLDCLPFPAQDDFLLTLFATPVLHSNLNTQKAVLFCFLIPK